MIFFLFFYATFSFAQTGNNIIKTNEIDSLISVLDKNYNEPKKLYNILDASTKIDYPRGISKMHLILSFYYRKLNEIDSAFYHINNSIRISKKNNLDKQLYNSYLSLGSIYGRIKNYKKSLEFYLKSYNYYKKQGNDKHNVILRALQINIASTYSLLGDYELANNYYMQNLMDPDFEKSSIHYCQLHQNIALNLKRQKKYEEALIWLNKGLVISETYQHRLIKNNILISLCDVYLLMNKSEEAERVYYLVDNDFNWDKDFYLGMIYLGMNRLKESEILFLKHIEREKDDRKSMESYLKLSEVYSKGNLWKKAKENKDRYYAIKDSLTSLNNKTVIKNNEIGFKLIEEELLNKQLDIENKLLISKNKRQSNIITGVAIISLIGVLCFFLLLKNIKVNRELKETKKNEKQLLEDKVELRENELHMTLVAIANRQKMFAEIKKEIDKFDKFDPNTKILKKKVKDLMVSGDNLSAISDRIESRYPGMVTRLKSVHPQLSNTEIKYCIFTKLNLTTKETASILGVSADTVKTSRSRIKKKMNVSESLSLKEYLDQLTST